MKRYILSLTIIALLFSCSGGQEHEHAQENEHDHALEAAAFTLYSAKTELFVEFTPLIVGAETRFAAHFTTLGESFEAIDEGSVTLTLEGPEGKQSVTASRRDVPGIFRLALTPKTAGIYSLRFDVITPLYSDTIVLDNVQVYADEKKALDDHMHSEEESGTITYLKEQAWKIDFATKQVKPHPFSNVIKTSGQILSAPGDEMIITSKAAGIVLFAGTKTIIGSEIGTSTALFFIADGDLTGNNLQLKYKESKADFEKLKAEFERAKDLVKDKIISEKEFLEVKLRYENAQNLYLNLSKNHSGAGQTITSPISGFVKNILIAEGQFVEAGTPLAIVSKNKKLILEVHVSQKHFSSLPAISSANFRTTESQTFTSTKELNGKVLSYGKSAGVSSPFIPITFEIDNKGDIIPGSVAEVFLRSTPLPEVLTVPVSALIEEQGIFFVYVQTSGESFLKKEVKLGISDGIDVQVVSGLSPDEWVVTKGGFQIKLASMSGTVPTHGHEH